MDPEAIEVSWVKFRSEKWRGWVEERERLRAEALGRLTPILERFMAGRIDALKLRHEVDSESKQHNLWGFGGLSGQMFFNMLCNNTKTEPNLSRALRNAISAPADRPAAVDRIAQFVTFVEEENRHVDVPRKRASPGYAPFFLSFFWNLQRYGELPIYYPSAVSALDSMGIDDLSEIADPSQRYDRYCDWMDKLRSLLSDRHKETVSLIEVQNFLYSVYREIEEEPERAPGVTAPDAVIAAESDTEEFGTEHTEIQWILAKTGKMRGYKVHVAKNDAGKAWKGERLGDVGGDPLPLYGYGDEDRKYVDLIDIVWFKGNEITHLFEIESSTSIYSGLLRMSDLLAMQPSLRPSLVIAAPKEREAEAGRVMERPTFRRLREEGRKMEFKSFEDIRALFDMELRGGVIH